MGLFDFAQDIGNKIFGESEPNPAEKIYQYIEDRNPGLEKFSVKIVDGVVTLVGLSNSAEAVQKAVLMAGNIKGVKEVISKIYITPNAKDPEPNIDMEAIDNSVLEPENVEYYIIQNGDTLSKIAQQYYGKAMEYPRIFEANREVIKDPDLIFVGQKIRIPMH